MNNSNNNVTRVFKAFEDDPAAMNQLLTGNETEVIRGILNDQNISDEELQEVTRQVNENNVMKLYLGADGQIDANQLLGMTGGFTSVERGKKTDAIGALLDGKLDIKDLLALITLMSGNSSSSHSNSSGGLLGSLFGGSQQQQQQTSPLSLFNSLLNAAQPQQQTQQQAPSLFSSLFGNSQQQQQQQQQAQQNAQLNALLQALAQQQAQQAQQQQQQAQPQGQTMNQLLGTLLGQAQQQAQQQQTQTSSNSLLGSLFGQNSQQSSGQTQNSVVLNAPLFTEAPAANNNQSAASSVNQFLGQSATNSNGTVNVNSMFDLINILMGAKK